MKGANEEALAAKQLPGLRHCELALVQGAIVLRDLQSMNGTELNGVPVTSRCRVLPGDRISVGDTQLRVSFQEPL